MELITVNTIRTEQIVGIKDFVGNVKPKLKSDATYISYNTGDINCMGVIQRDIPITHVDSQIWLCGTQLELQLLTDWIA